MKKTLIFTVAAARVLAAYSVQANMVVNPKFDTSPGGTPYLVQTSDDNRPFAWVAPLNYAYGDVSIISAGIPNGLFDGNNVAELSSSFARADPAELYQNITVTPNMKYVVSFEAEVEAAPPWQGLLITVLGGSWHYLDIGATGWTQYTYTVTPAESAGLWFDWSDVTPDGLETLYLDDLSVTPVPETGAFITDCWLLAPLVPGMTRILRKCRPASQSRR